MVLSKKQEDAIKQIKRMEERLGKRWFVCEEIPNIPLYCLLDFVHYDLRELVQKGYLEEQEFEGTTYYRFRGGI